MNINYIRNLMERLDFPQESIPCILDCAEKIAASDARVSFEDTARILEATNFDYDKCMEGRFANIAARAGTHEYTSAMVYLLSAAEKVEKKYAELGYSEELFTDTMGDLRCKLLECKEVKGVWGTHDARWLSKLIRMDLFKLGRFQYEKIEFEQEIFGVAGNYIRKGDTVLNFHIPSTGGPLTDEVRFDSYRRAYEFFYPGEKKPKAFVCHSWLFWPDYEEYFPEHLNIKKLCRDLTIIKMSEPFEKFEDAWRVFGSKAELPIDELPTDTSQRRALVQFCRDGKKHGDATGAFFFDGEKIIH